MIPIASAWSVEQLQNLVSGLMPDDILFPPGPASTKREGPRARVPFRSVAVLRKRLQFTCAEAEVDPTGICSHAIRHTMVTQALGVGPASAQAVKSMAGHSRIAVTEGYMHANVEHALPAAYAMGELIDVAAQGRPALRSVAGISTD